MDRRTFENLSREIRVRALMSEKASIIEAFVAKFVQCVGDGASTYYFKQKKETD